MKRLLLSLALLMPYILFSAPVSESRCRSIAAEFMRSRNVDCGTLTLVTGRPDVKSSFDNPAYFIYNTGGKGFVIVSADSSVPAILGYSDSGSVSGDVVPVNFREWMDMWEAIIADCRESGAGDSPDFIGYTDEVIASSEDKLLYDTALWGQGAPYNKFCPGTPTSVTGCGAVATCIVMNYHKWPDQGVKEIPGYVTSTNRYSISKIPVSDQLYDWDNMKMSYNSSSSEAEKNAVGKLMYEVGVMLQSDYDDEGTSSTTTSIPSALKTYLKYDASVMLKEASYYPTAKWLAMLKENLRNNGPMIYTAQSSSIGGHAFVVDGYEGDKLHINWGWNGSNNGYYVFPYFDTFTESHIVVFDIKKDEGGQPQDDLLLYSSQSVGHSGILVDGTIEPGVEFDADVKSIGNLGDQAFNGQIALSRVDKNEICKEIIGAGECTIQKNYGVDVSFKSCILDGPFHPGDRLMVAYKSSVTPDWTIVRYDMEDASMIGEIPLADAKSIEESTKLKYVLSDKMITLSLKLGVEVELLDVTGTPVSGVVSRVDDYNVVINVSGLSSGTYAIKLTKDDELKFINVKL